jgi:hypothetical protein
LAKSTFISTRWRGQGVEKADKYFDAFNLHFLDNFKFALIYNFWVIPRQKVIDRLFPEKAYTKATRYSFLVILTDLPSLGHPAEEFVPEKTHHEYL